MKKNIGILTAFLLAGLALTASAAEIIPKDSSGNSSVDAGQHKNIYAVAANIIVNAPVAGDAVVAGGTININGNIEQEALAAGGNISINGTVGSQARVAGGNISLNNSVGGDAVVAGGNINLTDKAAVAGDALLAGGNINVSGPVAGYLKAAGGVITINGRISGNVNVVASKQLIFGPKAEVLGNITLRSPNPAQIDPSAKVGAILYTKIVRKNAAAALKGLLTIAFLIQLLAWIIAGLLALKFFKQPLEEVGLSARQKPGLSLLVGFITVIVAPILAVILLFTFVGYYLALMLITFFAGLILVSGITAAVSLGTMIVRYLSKSPTAGPDWQGVVIGAVVWQLLKFVPVLGWLITAFLYILVVGAIVLRLKRKFSAA